MFPVLKKKSFLNICVNDNTGSALATYRAHAHFTERLALHTGTDRGKDLWE